MWLINFHEALKLLGGGGAFPRSHVSGKWEKKLYHNNPSSDRFDMFLWTKRNFLDKIQV